MKTVSILIAVGMLAAAFTAHAQSGPVSNDQVDCDGRVMSERSCRFIREREDRSEQVRQKILQEQIDREKRKSEAAQRMALEKIEREERYEKEREAARQRELQEQRETAQLQKKCGADFRRPAIGQSIERFRLCVAEVELIGQINRADGVVSIYEGAGYTVHGMKGKVVAWTN